MEIGFHETYEQQKLAEKYPEVAKDEEIYNVTESRRLTEKEIK